MGISLGKGKLMKFPIKLKSKQFFLVSAACCCYLFSGAVPAHGTLKAKCRISTNGSPWASEANAPITSISTGQHDHNRYLDEISNH